MSKRDWPETIGKVLVIGLLIATVVLTWYDKQVVNAQGPSYTIIAAKAAVIDTPAIALTTGTADTTATPTSGMHTGQFTLVTGTVTGTYTTCTAQVKTAVDGANYLTLGSGVSVTISSNTTNAFEVIEQLGTTSVTTSANSATVALGYGRLTKLTLACSGAYGTSAPMTVSANYH